MVGRVRGEESLSHDGGKRDPSSLFDTFRLIEKEENAGRRRNVECLIKDLESSDKSPVVQKELRWGNIDGLKDVVLKDSERDPNPKVKIYLSI